MSSPSRGAALMSHFGCVLLHFQAMDDILWEISDTESNQGSYTTYHSAWIRPSHSFSYS